jgi:hypothetical protein
VSKAAVRQMVERAANQIRPELQARGVSVQYMPAGEILPSQRGSASHRDRVTPPPTTSPLRFWGVFFPNNFLTQPVSLFKSRLYRRA